MYQCSLLVLSNLGLANDCIAIHSDTCEYWVCVHGELTVAKQQNCHIITR